MDMNLFIDLLVAMVKAVESLSHLTFTRQDATHMAFIIEGYHTAMDEDWPVAEGYSDHLEYHVFCAYDALNNRAFTPDELRMIIRMGDSLYTIVEHM